MAGGGGATSIAGASGLLNTLNVSNIYIVAGAGGGAYYHTNGAGYSNNGASGGGGGYYGGGSAAHAGSGGGSGYIGNPLLSNKVMYCYNCGESSDVNTKTVSTTCAEETPTENCAKKWNGYVKITFIE